MTSKSLADAYRPFALGLLAVLIASAVGQWAVGMRWAARMDEKHKSYDHVIATLMAQSPAPLNGAARLAVVEDRSLAILARVEAIDNKLDLYIFRRTQLQLPRRPGEP